MNPAEHPAAIERLTDADLKSLIRWGSSLRFERHGRDSEGWYDEDECLLTRLTGEPPFGATGATVCGCGLPMGNHRC